MRNSELAIDRENKRDSSAESVGGSQIRVRNTNFVPAKELKV